MKRIGAWSLVLLLSVLAASADRAPAAGNDRSKAELELLALETAWDDAVAAKDRAKLEEIIADDFIMINANGSVSTRSEMLDWVMAPEVKVEPFKTEDVRVRIYGSTALLSGWFSLRGTSKGEPFEAMSRYTDVYVKSGGKWRAVLGQATRLPKRPGS
jgi:ketosteroid isomerase-like protein